MIQLGPYKIEITQGQKSISFGTRYVGHIGKDILAVKVALGIVQLYEDISDIDQPENVDPSQDPPVPLDTQGWFDCGSGKGIDIVQASTFDLKMQTALINYQVQNQFLILCYLFEKYGVRNLIGYTSTKYLSFLEQEEYSRSILNQLESITILFDSILGTLDESTIAIMHGWLPHSSIGLTGYTHSNLLFQVNTGEVVTDVIPEVLYSDFLAGRFGQDFDSLIEAGAIPDSALSNNQEKLQYYATKVSSDASWIKEVPEPGPLPDIFNPPPRQAEGLEPGDPYSIFPFGSIDYTPKIRNVSALYEAAIKVLNNPHASESEQVRTTQERTENLKRAFYPDPFTNPDPFFIDDDKIGFFMETNFVLSPEGPLPNTREETIYDLEDRALKQVLEFYNKPDIWHFIKSEDNTLFNVEYLGGLSYDQFPETGHSGEYPPSRNVSSELRAQGPSYQTLTQTGESIRRQLGTIERNIEIKKEELQAIRRGNISASRPQAIVETEIRTLEAERDDLLSAKASVAFAIINWPNSEQRREDFYVLSTDDVISTFEEDSNYALSWRYLEEYNYNRQDPLIKFVEYRTPSLRPGQAYRAFFMLNKKKFDLITEGYSFIEDSQETSGASNPRVENQLLCGDEDSLQSQRTLEEYRIHANKKRKEIVRKLREEAERTSTFHRGGSIDLGYFGPFDFNAAFSGLYGLSGMTSEYEYTKAILNMVGQGGEWLLEKLNILDTDIEALNDYIEQHDKNLDVAAKDPKDGAFRITLQELKDRIEKAKKDLREADAIVTSEGVQFAEGSAFSGGTEANHLGLFYNQLEEMLDPDLAQEFIDNPEETALAFSFEPSYSEKTIGPTIGKQLKSVHVFLLDKDWFGGRGLGPGGNDPNYYVGGFYIPPFPKSEENLIISYDRDKDKYKGFSSLFRARTVNYISNIVRMTSPLPGSGGEFITSFFDDGRGACKDLGIDFDKNMAIAYVGKNTSGLKTQAPKEDPSSEAFMRWGEENFVDPVVDWWKTTKNNASKSWESSFNEEAALKMMGKMCTLEDLYKEFFDKLDLASLLCDYLKCMKMPGFDLKLPKFHLPPLPKIPMLGWYKGMWEFIYNNFKQILIRLLCTFVRTLIDKLSVPFCEEQLQEFLAAGASADTPIVAEALKAALTDTGIPAGKEEEAKNFFDDTAKILTGQELCWALEGRQLDEPTMLMISRIAEQHGLSDVLDSPEAITNYYGVLGGFMPGEFCQAMENMNELLVPGDCEQVASELQGVRNRLQSGDSTLTNQEIDEIMSMAEKNLKDSKASLEALSGSDLSAFVGPLFAPGNPNAIESNFPEYIHNEMKFTTDSVFKSAHSAYISGLGSVVPAMSIMTPDSPKAGRDETYMDDDILKLESATTQMAMYSKALEASINHRAELILSIEGEDLGGDLTLAEVQNRIEKENQLQRACEIAFENSKNELDAFIEQAVQTQKMITSYIKNVANGLLKLAQGFAGFIPDARPPGAGGLNWEPPTPEQRKSAFLAHFNQRVTLRPPLGVAFDRRDDGQLYGFDQIEGNLLNLITNNPGQLYPEYGGDDGLDFQSWHELGLETILIEKMQVWLEETEPSLSADEKQAAENYYDRVTNDVTREQFEIAYPSEITRNFNNLITMRRVRATINEQVAFITYKYWTSEGRSIDYAEMREEQNRDETIFENILEVGYEGYGRVAGILQGSGPQDPVTDWEGYDPNRSYEDVRLAEQYVDAYVRAAYPADASGFLDDGISQRDKILEIKLRQEPVYYSLNHLSEIYRESIIRENLLLEAFDPPRTTAAIVSLLYTVFELEEVSEPGGQVHIVHKKHAVPTEISEDFIVVNNLEQYGPQNNVDRNNLDPSDHRFYRTAEGNFLSGVLATTEQREQTEELTYERFYEKSLDMSDSDDFCLVVAPNAREPYAPGLTPGLPHPPFLISNNPAGPSSYNLVDIRERRRQHRRYKRFIREGYISALREIGYSGDNYEAPGTGDDEFAEIPLLEVVQRRITFLAETINGILQRRPNLVSGKHLYLLKNTFKTIGQNTLATINEADSNNLKFIFPEGPYNPSIELVEHPSSRYLDRYDVTITGDTFLGPIATQTKTLKFCERLPDNIIANNRAFNEDYFSKKEAFSQNTLRSLNEYGDVSLSNELIESLSSDFYPDLYQRTKKGILSLIVEKLVESKMFDSDYAVELEKRIGGKPFFEVDCLTNRYGLTEASILAFDKIILDDIVGEVMSEYAKDQNNIYNRDFDDLTPFELALQNLAFKAYIRVCLVDMLLKGGIAFAVWDIEPIISSPIYKEYAYCHIKRELDKNRILQTEWKTLIERITGVTNPFEALKLIISQELVKLPDYSKQIFNPNEKDKDWHNWFIETAIPIVEISEDDVRSPVRNDMVFPIQYGRNDFESGESYFVMEEYVDIEGALLSDDLTRGINGIYRSNGERQMIPVIRFNQLLIAAKQRLNQEEYFTACSNSSVKHGMRLVFINVGLYAEMHVLDDSVDIDSMEPFFRQRGEAGLNRIYNLREVKEKTFSEKSYRTAIVDRNSDIHLSLSLPISKFEREIDVENCPAVFFGDGGPASEPGINSFESTPFMKSSLMNNSIINDGLFEHIFPVRRYMSIASIFSTSVLSGYNDLPGVLDPTKSLIAFVIQAAGTPASQKLDLSPISDLDFEKMLNDKFPSDPEDTSCFEFPDIGKEFWNAFFKDLAKLFKMLPSIILRNLANQLDPAYKEMRAHYLNCDIKHLTTDGLTFNTKDTGLVNGLKLRKGKKNRTKNGHYAPVALTFLRDFATSFQSPWSKAPRRLLRSTLKLVTYIYSGNAPFVDLSGLFKIPCAEVDEKWLEDGVYDAGMYGRYGHPLTPFTLFALITPELEADKERQEGVCEPEENNDCEDV